MNKLMFTVAIAATAAVLSAQEMAAAPAATQTTTVAVSATVKVEDAGQEIAQTAAVKCGEAAKEVDSTAEKTATAEEKVDEILEKVGISIGYDAKSKAIIQKGTAVLACKDPAKDPGFMMLREQAANIAFLDAKANIIKAINSEFEGVDRSVMCTSEEVDENAQAVADAKAAVEAKRDELAKALTDLNAVDGQMVAEMTIGDRFNALLDATIKKIDANYNPDAIKAEKKLDAEAAKTKYAELKDTADALAAEYKVLQEKAAKLSKDPALESSSIAKIASKMPLLGSSIITQAESWDGEAYQVTVAVVWSPKLQDAAVKMGTGDFKEVGKPGKLTRKDWIKAQNWPSMVGARRFVDENGRQVFVGISAVDLAGPVVQQNAKKKIADTMAIKNVAMSIMCDMETYREAKQNLAVYPDDTKKCAQKLAETTAQKCNMNLKGCMQLCSKTVKNPISGRKIYVSAYYIDPASSAEAAKVLEKLYRDAAKVDEFTQRQRKQAIEHEKMRKAEVERLAKEAAAKVKAAKDAAAKAKAIAEAKKLKEQAELQRKAAEEKRAREAREAAAARKAVMEAKTAEAKARAEQMQKEAEARVEMQRQILEIRKEAERNVDATIGVFGDDPDKINTDF